MSFQDRVDKIEKLEQEILRKASGLIKPGRHIFLADLFVLGAVKRVLALASGFRTLMADRNFTSCACLLRMQIDSAARVNALKLVESMDALCQSVMAGGRFDKQKDRGGHFLRDSRLIEELSADFPWVTNVYKETSGFVHLSERHMFASMTQADDATATMHLTISATEPDRPDEAYFEILDCFFEATKMAGAVILGYVAYSGHMAAAASADPSSSK